MPKGATGRPRGAPAKPVERKRAAGNPGKRALPNAPLPGDGLDSDGGIPTPPADLETTGLTLWNQLWESGRTWLAPGADRPLIEDLCRAADEAEKLRQGLLSGEIPRWYLLSNGAEVTHPAVTQLKDARVQRTSWLSMLGFSPADRARLGLAEVRVRDELDELARKREQRRADAAAS